MWLLILFTAFSTKASPKVKIPFGVIHKACQFCIKTNNALLVKTQTSKQAFVKSPISFLIRVSSPCLIVSQSGRGRVNVPCGRWTMAETYHVDGSVSSMNLPF